MICVRRDGRRTTLLDLKLRSTDFCNQGLVPLFSTDLVKLQRNNNYEASNIHPKPGTLLVTKGDQRFMSTETINLRLTQAWWPAEERRQMLEAAPDTHFKVSHVPFEVVYQGLYSPSPTPEEIRREYFLLECD